MEQKSEFPYLCARSSTISLFNRYLAKKILMMIREILNRIFPWSKDPASTWSLHGYVGHQWRTRVSSARGPMLGSPPPPELAPPRHIGLHGWRLWGSGCAPPTRLVNPGSAPGEKIDKETKKSRKTPYCRERGAHSICYFCY